MLCFVFEALGEGVAGVVSLVPVAVAVGGDAPGDGLVVASAQVGEEVGVEVVGAGGAGLVDGCRGLAQYGDDLGGPFLPVRVQLEYAL